MLLVGGAKGSHEPKGSTEIADYNGWKNRQTWNVMSWISNDENLYRSACAYVTAVRNGGIKKPHSLYKGFISHSWLAGGYTPDRIKWNGQALDYKALDEALDELV